MPADAVGPIADILRSAQGSAGNQAVARTLARTEATEAPQDTGETPGDAWRWLTWAGISVGGGTIW